MTPRDVPGPHRCSTAGVGRSRCAAWAALAIACTSIAEAQDAKPLPYGAWAGFGLGAGHLAFDCDEPAQAGGNCLYAGNASAFVYSLQGGVTLWGRFRIAVEHTGWHRNQSPDRLGAWGASARFHPTRQLFLAAGIAAAQFRRPVVESRGYESRGFILSGSIGLDASMGQNTSLTIQPGIIYGRQGVYAREFLPSILVGVTFF